MSIILRNTKNMFSKEQKVVTEEFLDRWDMIRWGSPDHKNVVSRKSDEKRKNYKVVYR